MSAALGAPSSTFFTTPPHWEWLVITYFFVGGLAGGSYFLAVLVDFLGTAADRRLARLGYYVAFAATLASGLLLILDLKRPLRFWHMLIASENWRPLFKYWSPMSIGSWALLIFGAFTLLAFLAALAEAGRLRWRGFESLRPPTVLGSLAALLGGLAGLYVSGYTGVLLAVTNRPLWADTPLLGMLFLVSAASISAAFLYLLGRGTGVIGPGLVALKHFDTTVVALELGVLIAVAVSLGPVFRIWLSGWGVLLLFGVVLAGMVAPLVLHWRPRLLGELSAPAAALLILIGGFLLRVVIVLSSEGV
jgi:protein NrfD